MTSQSEVKFSNIDNLAKDGDYLKIRLSKDKIIKTTQINSITITL